MTDRQPAGEEATALRAPACREIPAMPGVAIATHGSFANSQVSGSASCS